jgi:hypothetical protein
MRKRGGERYRMESGSGKRLGEDVNEIEINTKEKERKERLNERTNCVFTFTPVASVPTATAAVVFFQASAFVVLRYTHSESIILLHCCGDLKRKDRERWGWKGREVSYIRGRAGRVGG